MKGVFILMVAGLFSASAFAQQDKDSARIEHEKRYQKKRNLSEEEELRQRKWVSIKDSLLSDSLFASYSDFRSDPNGKLGLRIKYFMAENIPFEGLTKKRILEFLGKPNSIDSIKFNGDSLQSFTLYYNMGSLSDSITDKQHRNGKVGSLKGYFLTIDIINNRAVYEPSSYYSITWSADW
jgi:hypothetical protein